MPTFRKTFTSTVSARFDETTRISGAGVGRTGGVPLPRRLRYYRVYAHEGCRIELYTKAPEASYKWTLSPNDARLFAVALLAIVGAPAEREWAGRIVEIYSAEGLTATEAMETAGAPPSIEDYCMGAGKP